MKKYFFGLTKDSFLLAFVSFSEKEVIDCSSNILQKLKFQSLKLKMCYININEYFSSKRILFYTLVNNYWTVNSGDNSGLSKTSPFIS